MVEKQIEEPYFRYIPDRATIQRFLTRCSNMKDDLAEFDLYQSAEDGGALGMQEGGTISSTI